jgi:hypothetical protein
LQMHFGCMKCVVQQVQVVKSEAQFFSNVSKRFPRLFETQLRVICFLLISNFFSTYVTLCTNSSVYSSNKNSQNSSCVLK